MVGSGTYEKIKILEGVFQDNNDFARFYEYAPQSYAMVYTPRTVPDLRIGFFLFNAGHRYRTGPHDLYVKIGLELSQKGIYVITPDPPGLGDGFQEFRFLSISEHQGRIQRGLYVRSALLSLEFFRKKLGLSHIIVSGLCGGSSTAITCAYLSNKIDGIIAWGCPFRFADSPPLSRGSINSTKFEKQLRKISPGIRVRILNPIYKPPLRSAYVKRVADVLLRKLGLNPSFDYVLASQIQCLLRTKRRIIFVYSECDKHYRNFVDFFLPYYGKGYDFEKLMKVLRGSNHVVSDLQGQRELCDIIKDFCWRTVE